MKTRYSQPFLKWAGSKRKQIARLNRKLPKGDRYRRLVEPFVGSGAVFMGTDYESYLLADSNPDLIELFRLLRDEGDWFVDYVRGLFMNTPNTEESYYKIRAEFNELVGLDADIEKRAAYFVWLNRHGYNGLCRYNASGKFNVPCGKYKSVFFPETEMRAFSNKLQERVVLLLTQSFTETFTWLQGGDVVYCDPPFVPLSGTANFTTYSAGGFNSDMQLQLAALAAGTARLGVPVVISNHSVTDINNIYRGAGASLAFHKAGRSISCKGSRRKPAREVLALFKGAA